MLTWGNISVHWPLALWLDNKGQVPNNEQFKEWNELYTESQHMVRYYSCVSLCTMDKGTTRSACASALQLDSKGQVPTNEELTEWNKLYTKS
jgi:hypothetical protein